MADQVANSLEPEKRLRPLVENIYNQEISSRMKKAQDGSLSFIGVVQRGVDADGFEVRIYEVGGSRGNSAPYQTTIGRLPSCTCPDSKIRGPDSKYRSGPCCKHVKYVLLQVLRMPKDLARQNAFLSTELEPYFQRSKKPRPIDTRALSPDSDDSRVTTPRECFSDSDSTSSEEDASRAASTTTSS